jgi:KDO2-lipid IV(A) lauroyltransferase
MNALKTALVRVMLHLGSVLPLGVARGLGRGAGRLSWLIGGRSRRVTQKNIALAWRELNPEQQAKLARDSLCATGELIGEMGHIWLRPWAYVSTLVKSVQGVELVSEALACGRGVVILAPHLGNWEILGLHLGTLGKTVSLYEAPRLAGLGPLIKQARQRTGAQLVPANRSGVASLLRNVRRGGIVGVLPDQVPDNPGSGENIPFMGVPCFTGTLAARLIQRSGALVVFGFAQRVAGGFALHYQAVDSALYSQDRTLALEALNAGIESGLRFCPEQYQWEYKRFRTWPRTKPGFYEGI